MAHGPQTEPPTTTHPPFPPGVTFRYLPGVTLPENVVAITDLPESVAGATILVFVLPHQFVPRICSQARRVTGLGGGVGLARWGWLECPQFFRGERG